MLAPLDQSPAYAPENPSPNRELPYSDGESATTSKPQLEATLSPRPIRTTTGRPVARDEKIAAARHPRSNSRRDLQCG